jgi:flagellar operon protein
MKGIGPTISNVNPATTGALERRTLEESSRQPNARGGIADSVFRDQLSALQNVMPSTASAPAAISPLKFSNHAVDRMQARGIRFSPDEMTKIEGAVNKAASKGAKDTLLLTDSSALIVSVKDKTVVTVMDKAQLKDNVFTNIDSTVMI